MVDSKLRGAEVSAEATMQRSLIRPVLVGIVIGSFMGFVDSYGYAVTGYTVAEIELVVAPIIAGILLGRRSDPRNIFIASVTAFGIALSTVITSGMVITYFLTSKIYWIFYREKDFPSWLYSSDHTCLPNIFSCEWPYTYLALAALSLIGVGFAYLLRHIFLDKLNLPYPLGIASALMSQIMSFVRSMRAVIIAIITGFSLQIILMIYTPGSIDLTPSFAEHGYGILLALSFDLIILLISLLLPPRASASIGSGSLIAGFLLLPLGASMHLYPLPPHASMDTLVNSASWYMASIVFGSVFPLMAIVARNVGVPLMHLARTLGESRRMTLLLLSLLMGLASILIIAYMRSGYPGPFFLVFGAVLVLIIVPLLVIITSWGAGEAGTVSQAFYPASTIYMYMSGFRGFAPYVYMDHYLGIPMPSTLSASSLHILRASRILGITPSLILAIFSLSYLVGSIITIYYGYLLITLYGNDPSKMPLDRWIPYAIWSLSVYRGELNPVTIIPGAAIGAATIASLLLLGSIAGRGFSPIPLIIGLTLTPDLGILFIMGSFLRWFISRFGAEAEKQLIIISGSSLGGGGIAIVIYTIASMAGIF